MSKRVGIFAGSFDPVHHGHVDFALAAIGIAKLDEVYFLPERLPRHKKGVTHFAHRLAMLKIATQPYQNLKVMELPDRQFSVSKTLPRLNQSFVDDQLFLMIGSDVLEQIGEWPLVDRLFSRMGLIVGLRNSFSESRATSLLEQLAVGPEAYAFKSPTPKMSAAKIRQAISKHQKVTSLDSVVQQYIKDNWLYSAV